MLALAASLFLAIPLTPERPIASPQRGAVTPLSSTPALASNGESYLASWRTFTSTHLLKVDDAGGVLLEREMPAQLESVTAIGRDYIGITSDGTTRRVIRIDGSTLAARQSATLLSASATPVVTSNGQTALIASDDGSAQIVEADGNVAGAPIALGTWSSQRVAAGAVPNGAYVVVSENYDPVYYHGVAMAAIVDAGGTLVRKQIPLPTADDGHVLIGQGSIASDGTNLLAAWRNRANIYVVVLSADGTIISGPTMFRGGDRGNDPPRAAWNGRQYVVTFDRTYILSPVADIAAQHVDANGQLAGELEVVVSGKEHAAPVIASTGRSTLVTWQRSKVCPVPGGSNESARLLEPSGAPFVLSQSELEQQHQAVAAASNAMLAVWTEVADLPRLRMTLLPQGGAVDLPGTGDWAAVGTDGNGFLIAFVGSPDLATSCYGGVSIAAVDASGHVGLVTRIGYGAFQARPAIAWNGSEYAVVWQNGQAQLLGVRVARDGTPLDVVPHALSAAVVDAPNTWYATQDPAIAWTGQHYVVSWNLSKSVFSPFSGFSFVAGRRTRLLGRDLEPEADEVRFDAPSTDCSAMAWNGSEGLLTWCNEADGGLWGTRLTADGNILTARRLDALGYASGPPSLAWNGREWLVAYGRRIYRVAPDLTLLASDDLGSGVGATTVAAVGEATTVVYDRQGGGLPAPRVFVRGPVPARRRIAP